jgi:protein SCO1/2
MSQKSGIYKSVFLALGIAVLSLGMFINKITSVPALNIEQLKERGIFLFEPPRLVKDFELLNHRGEVVTKESLQGKWSLVFFGFTNCPDVCPTTLAMLNKVMGKIKDPEVLQTTQVILVTVDPARDTVESLGKYVPYFNPNFIGLTGDFLQILSVAGNLNAAFVKVPLDNGNYTMDHSANVFLLNDKGDFQGFIKPPFKAADFATNYTAARKFVERQ